jgi:hypothetical protein
LDDIAFLTDRGVFNVPESPLRDEILKSYAEYVHPLLPLLDLSELLKAIYSGAEHCRISLMLFYAILLAGASFVNISILRAAGFPDRKNARKVFFQRTKVRAIGTLVGDVVS